MLNWLKGQGPQVSTMLLVKDFHKFYEHIYRKKYFITTSNFKNGKKHLYNYLSNKFKFDLDNITFVYHAIRSLIKKVLN